MNFLAHFYFCHETPEHIAGSLLGDFVKGNDWQNYSQNVQTAILLHRRIDSLTDKHPIVLASRQRFTPATRRYAGIILDMYFDHFLACDWEHYHSDSLKIFSSRMYQGLQQQKHIMPERAIQTVNHMHEHNWLESYQTLDGLTRAMTGLSRRLKRANPLMESVSYLEANYKDFKQDFTQFLLDFKP